MQPRSSWTAANLGERTSAMLETVLGATLKSSNLLSSAILSCGRRELRPTPRWAAGRRLVSLVLVAPHRRFRWRTTRRFCAAHFAWSQCRWTAANGRAHAAESCATSPARVRGRVLPEDRVRRERCRGRAAAAEERQALRSFA